MRRKERKKNRGRDEGGRAGSYLGQHRATEQHLGRVSGEATRIPRCTQPGFRGEAPISSNLPTAGKHHTHVHAQNHRASERSEPACSVAGMRPLPTYTGATGIRNQKGRAALCGLWGRMLQKGGLSTKLLHSEFPLGAPSWGWGGRGGSRPALCQQRPLGNKQAGGQGHPSGPSTLPNIGPLPGAHPAHSSFSKALGSPLASLW